MMCVEASATAWMDRRMDWFSIIGELRATRHAGPPCFTYTRFSFVPRIIQPRAEEVASNVYRSGQVCGSVCSIVCGSYV